MTKEEIIKKVKRVAKVSVTTLHLLTLFALTGCNETMECNREEPHFHIYSDEGVVATFDSEMKYEGKFHWTEDTVDYSDELKEEIDLLKEKGLVKVEDNLDYLKEHMDDHQPCTEYEYKYKNYEILYYFKKGGGISYKPMEPVTTKDADGNTKIKFELNTPFYGYVTKKDWSMDEQVENQTGEIRYTTTNYIMWTIDEKGDEVVFTSVITDDITSAPIDSLYFDPTNFYETTQTVVSARQHVLE